MLLNKIHTLLFNLLKWLIYSFFTSSLSAWSMLSRVILPTDLKIRIHASLAECFPWQWLFYLDPKEWIPTSFLKPQISKSKDSGHETVLTGSYNLNHMFIILHHVYVSPLQYILLPTPPNVPHIHVSISAEHFKKYLWEDWTSIGKKKNNWTVGDRWDLKGGLDGKMHIICLFGWKIGSATCRYSVGFEERW